LLVSKTSEQYHFPFSPSAIFWGGPDRPSRCLRNLLEERIHAVPPGGEILWVTYYFRDEALAEALLQAKRRGVKVRVAIEGNPRTCAVNSRVLKLLGGNRGLGGGLRAIRHRLVDNRFFRISRLHEKMYYFSHPVPSVMVGTFNPSGTQPEDPDIIRKIGDQDRGHNMLMNIVDPVLVEGFHEHALHLFNTLHGPWERYLSINNRLISSGKTRAIFFPRSKWADFYRLFEGLKPGNTLRMAVSHFNDRGICKLLFALAQRGVHVEIIAHATLRRVPSWVEEQMLRYKIIFHRYVHPEGLPMHNKFMLIDTSAHRIVTFGSMNLSVRSLHANHELLVADENPEVYQAFRHRWEEMLMEMKGWQK